MNEGGGVGVGSRGDASEDGLISANPWMPAVLANASVATWGAVNLGVATVYFVLGLIVSRFFAAYGLFPAPIWLPAGIATVSAMAASVRVMPGIFLGAFLTNALLFHPPLIVSLIISVTNAVGPVVGAMILRRLRPD